MVKRDVNAELRAARDNISKNNYKKYLGRDDISRYCALLHDFRSGHLSFDSEKEFYRLKEKLGK